MSFSKLVAASESTKVIDPLKSAAFTLVSKRYEKVDVELLLVPTLCIVLIGFNTAIYEFQKHGAAVDVRIGQDIIKQALKIFISDISREKCALDGAKKFAEIIGKQSSFNHFTREQSVFLLQALCVTHENLNMETGHLYDLIDEVITLAKLKIEQYLSGEITDLQTGSLL